MESASPRVQILTRSQSRSLSFNGDSDYGHVQLRDCTLSLVLCGFGQCTVLAGRATSNMACHHVTLLPHIYLKQSSLSIQSVCHTVSPGVGVGV